MRIWVEGIELSPINNRSLSMNNAPSHFQTPPPGDAIYLTGTDTDVGKTYVGCLLAEAAYRAGIRVAAYKPVASGFPTATGSDGEKLWKATGCRGSFESVSPQRFTAPFAPSVAAALEGKRVDEEKIFSGFEASRAENELVLVEGAGGLFSPVSSELTNADLVKRMGIPVILVASWKLGLVHQVLCALHAAKSVGIDTKMIVLSETQPQPCKSAKLHAQLLIEALGRNAAWQEIPLLKIEHSASRWPAEVKRNQLTT